MTIKIKRIYEPVTDEDGVRILVDRLWPRGISKEKAAIEFWFREIAPSDGLRKWYSHDPAKWLEFRRRYFRELKSADRVAELAQIVERSHVTFLFSSKEPDLNNARALKEYLEGKVKKK